MKKLLLASLAAAALTACGRAPLPVVANASAIAANAPLDAQSTSILTSGFRDLHMAVFTKLDASDDGYLDEYEASAAIDVKDFQKADKNQDGKVSKTEFINYASGNGLFGFIHQTQSDFMKQARNAMVNAFTKLDKNRDRLLDPAEMDQKSLAKVDMNLRIDALHVSVHITEVDDDVLGVADHTGDGKLTQAEWEDYCMLSFIKMINPGYHPGQDDDAPAT